MNPTGIEMMQRLLRAPIGMGSGYGTDISRINSVGYAPDFRDNPFPDPPKPGFSGDIDMKVPTGNLLNKPPVIRYEYTKPDGTTGMSSGYNSTNWPRTESIFQNMPDGVFPPPGTPPQVNQQGKTTLQELLRSLQ